MRLVLILFISFLITFNCGVENGWKEIKVFKTSIKTVEKKLGSSEVNLLGPAYNTDEALVQVEYSEGNCVNLKSGLGRYSLEKDVVIRYSVHLTKVIYVRDLKRKKHQYEKIEDPHQPDYIFYTSFEKGITITTWFDESEREVVGRIDYFPTKEQYEKHRCQTENN